ncbi:MAG: hemerythrin domain-containing protein [Ignavibacteria bacterium]|nr:hemerythrin domain-containing protein [Ignavibacteria bacterium]
MQKEEKLIFPYIMRMKKIANDREKYVTPPFGSVASPVKVMEKEHRNAYSELIIISKLMHSMITKNNNNASIRSLNEKFTEFISDFNFHIHLENNILFPKAIRLESKLKKQILKI